MDSCPNTHAAAADLTQNNSSNKLQHDTFNPDPIAKTRHTMTIPKIDAHFANLARDISSEPADRARAVYVNRQLVDQFGAKFGMSESQAKAAVDEEMSKRYAPNPWDAPAPRRLKQQQRISKVDRMKGEQSTGLVGGSRYSEEQWDLFECRLGYR